jgi:F-type H+-transporting ATPase subunit b
MNINLTLIGQSTTFAVFLWFCMKFVWPPIMAALNERKTRIADGLAAAEKGLAAEEVGRKQADSELQQAKEQAKEIISQAQRRADELVEEGKGDARQEGERLLHGARAEIDQERNQAREQLRKEVVAIALSGAEQVLMREVDADAHSEVLGKLAAGL